MKVMILNPPFLPMYSRQSRSPAVTKSSTLYYPYYLAYCTGVLDREVGLDVRLIDAPAFGWNHERLYGFVRDFMPDLLVCDTTTGSIYNDVDVASKIKDLSGAFTVLVGMHVSATAEESLRLSNSIDAIARKEFDYTIRDLSRLMRDNSATYRKELGAILGLSYRNENDEIRHNPDRPFIEDLDNLPFVAEVYKRHLAHYIERYFYGANLHPVMTILSGRGCPYQCAYCVQPQVFSGHRYRLRSVINVVDELAYINREFPQVRDIFIEDDTLTVNRKRARELSEEILNRGLKITWSANSRADCDQETLAIMKKAGCRLLCVGFESGDQTVLDNIGKRLTLEQIHAFMRAARKAGILIHGCFLVGNRGETKETLQKTLELALTVRPDTAQFYPIMVYPGTIAYRWAKDNGYLRTEDYRQWLTVKGLHNSVVTAPGLSDEELVRFCDHARRKFYLRPSYIASKLFQLIFMPGERSRILRASKTFFRFLFRNSRATAQHDCICLVK